MCPLSSCNCAGPKMLNPRRIEISINFKRDGHNSYFIDIYCHKIFRLEYCPVT